MMRKMEPLLSLKHETPTAAADSAKRFRRHRVVARLSHGGGACSGCGEIFQAYAAARDVYIRTVGIQAPQNGSPKGEGCGSRDKTTADTASSENAYGRGTMERFAKMILDGMQRMDPPSTALPHQHPFRHGTGMETKVSRGERVAPNAPEKERTNGAKNPT